MDLKKSTEKDLLKTLAESRKDLREFHFGLAGSKTKNIKKGNSLKKEIARILTELNIRKNNE